MSYEPSSFAAHLSFSKGEHRQDLSFADERSCVVKSRRVSRDAIVVVVVDRARVRHYTSKGTAYLSITAKDSRGETRPRETCCFAKADKRRSHSEKILRFSSSDGPRYTRWYSSRVVLSVQRCGGDAQRRYKDVLVVVNARRQRDGSRRRVLFGVSDC